MKLNKSQQLYRWRAGGVQHVSRLSAANIRSNNLQELHGLRIARFQHVVLALAPRTFVTKVCKSFTV
eukprot:4964763-Pyramimonas_sp.AAC.1